MPRKVTPPTEAKQPRIGRPRSLDIPSDGKLVPTGTILPFYGSGIKLKPEGYYYCDGSIISQARDPELYSLLTSANPELFIDTERCRLPDFRAELLRGFDDGRGIDRNRRFGSLQDEALPFNLSGTRIEVPMAKAIL